MKPHHRAFFSVCLLLAVLCGAGCATGSRTGAGGASDWVRTELYFSPGEWTENAPAPETEAAWRGFLDREVTPRFPDGLTVVDVYGQWRGAAAGSPVLREHSRLLVVFHPRSAEADTKIEAIRAAWKQSRGEESVLWVSEPASVRF